jgi:hypothetical protein
VGNLIDKDQDGFGGLVGFFADHLGHALADILFLFFAEGSGNPDAYVWHDSILRVDVIIFSDELVRTPIFDGEVKSFILNKKECPLAWYKSNHIYAGKKEN